VIPPTGDCGVGLVAASTYGTPPLKNTVSPGFSVVLPATPVANGSPGQCCHADEVFVPALESAPPE